MPKISAAASEGPVTINGVDELLAKLAVLPQLQTAGALNGLLAAGQDCMDDSKENFCPFRLGALRGSGVVFAEDQQVVLSYGGVGSGAEAYALEQHENLSYKHEIGGAKYLELAVIKWTPVFVERAGQSVSANVEKLSTGWASGDWKTVTVARAVPPGSVISGYTRASGKSVAAHYRRKSR